MPSLKLTALINDRIDNTSRILAAYSNVYRPVHHAVAFAFWKKILTNARAVAVLHANVLIDEADAINRLALENLFFMVASLLDPSTVDRLHDSARQDSWKMQGSLLNGESTVFDETRRGSLEAFERDSILTEAVPALFRIYEAADVAGLEFLYQSRYRLLSAESTHASFVSLTRTPSSVNADEVLASMIELLDLARAHAEEYAGPASA